VDQDQEFLKNDIVKQNFENDASHVTIRSSRVQLAGTIKKKTILAVKDAQQNNG